MLNYRKPIDEIFENLEKYHLYQQQTQGGIYYILAGSYELVIKQWIQDGIIKNVIPSWMDRAAKRKIHRGTLREQKIIFLI